MLHDPARSLELSVDLDPRFRFSGEVGIGLGGIRHGR
jgi:hypothetical protein